MAADREAQLWAARQTQNADAGFVWNISWCWDSVGVMDMNIGDDYRSGFRAEVDLVLVM
jgi:hypothetical protein